MRLIFGIILGALLTVGGAYISDSLRPAAGPDGAVVKPMVNWEVVQEKFKSALAAVQDGWTRLTGH
jgi:hypothetical protein